MNVCHRDRAARYPGIVARITAAAGRLAVVEDQRGIPFGKVRAHRVEQRRVAGGGQRMRDGIVIELARQRPQRGAHLRGARDACFQGLIVRPAKGQFFAAAA